MKTWTHDGFERLFYRIDSVPSPRDVRLRRLVVGWRRRAAGRVVPVAHDLADCLRADTSFGFVPAASDSHDYILKSGGRTIRVLLGEAGLSLMAAQNRRGAVRCRRLFDRVLEQGEPLLVEFEAEVPGLGPLICEMLALPVSSDGLKADGIVGGLALRPTYHAPLHPVHFVDRSPLLFAFERDRAFGQSVARRAGFDLTPLEEREFEDGEHKVRPMADVAGRRVFVIASLYGDPVQSTNDRLCRLLFFVAALKTNGADCVTAVVPYLCYQRKDRQTKPRDPLTGRYVAQLLEAAGTDQLITMEAHNLAALQNAFRCPLTHLDAYDIFAEHFVAKIGGDPVSVVSPDLGGAKRADAFRETLERSMGVPVGKAFLEKQRSMGRITGELFAGDVEGRVAIIFDDMISSGVTMARAASACRRHGASRVYLAATHGLFSQDALQVLSSPEIDGICVTNTVWGRVSLDTVDVIDVAPRFASAIPVFLS
ncbi:ribose-phosphate diphosphokinase [Martelella sp. AMO21009]